MAESVSAEARQPSGILPSFRGINSDARNLILSIALISFGTGIVYVTLALYLYAAGFSTTLIGIVSSTQFVAAVLTGIPVAMLADAYGRKKILAINLFLMGLAGMIWFLTGNLTAVLLGAFLFGMANSSSVSPFNALLTQKTKDERNRNDVFAILGFAGGIANGFGALASSSSTLVFHNYFGLSSVNSFRPLFLLEFVLCFSALIVIMTRVDEIHVAKNSKKSRKKLSFKLPKKSMPVVWKLSILGLIGLGAGLIVPLFALWFELKFGIGISVIGPLFSIVTFGVSIAGLFTPKIASKRGSVSTIVMTQLSSVALLVVIPFLANYALAGAAMVGRNILMNMSLPIQRSYYMGLFDPSERASAYSIVNTFDAVPRAWGPSIAGYLFSLGEYNTPFYITSVLYFAAISSFYFIFRNLKTN